MRSKSPGIASRSSWSSSADRDTAAVDDIAGSSWFKISSETSLRGPASSQVDMFQFFSSKLNEKKVIFRPQRPLYDQGLKKFDLTNINQIQ